MGLTSCVDSFAFCVECLHVCCCFCFVVLFNDSELQLCVCLFFVLFCVGKCVLAFVLYVVNDVS